MGLNNRVIVIAGFFERYHPRRGLAKMLDLRQSVLAVAAFFFDGSSGHAIFGRYNLGGGVIVKMLDPRQSV